MKQTSAVVEVLKRSLKAQGVTYRTLSKRLKLSESSVKRIFAQRTLTLERVEQILEILNMEWMDVARLLDRSKPLFQELFTQEQEEAFVHDEKLFSFCYKLIYGSTVDEIVKTYRLERFQAERYLKRLEELRLLDRMPFGKVRLLVDARIDWLTAGPLRAKYEARIREHFLSSTFSGEKEYGAFSSKVLSAGSQSALKRKLQLLVRDMETFSEVDRNVLREKKQMTSLMIGFRPFSFSFISGLAER